MADFRTSNGKYDCRTKYYILVDGYAGNECKFEFQIYNGNSCCTANLGSTEGTDKVLCYGDDITLGVTADPINFWNKCRKCTNDRLAIIQYSTISYKSF